MRQIAQKSNANLSAISYHFDGKEGLYRAVLAHYFKFMENIIDSAPKKPLDRLNHYVLHISEIYQKIPL